MSFRISNIHDYERFIAIDLGSYRIRASLYAIQEGKLIREKSACIRQNRKNMLDGSILDMQGVALVIDNAIHEACSDIDIIPEDIIIAFSPEICIHDTMASQYIREDHELPLHLEELDMMIERIEKASLLRAKEKAKNEYAIVHDDIRLVSSTLTSIIIDGRQVTNPIGLPGKHIRINVLNVFALASEYNILRSIVASLKRKTISIVPIALVFSKIVESGEHIYEDNVYIDIGYTHVTVVFEKKNEITFFDTFSIGSKMLMDMLGDAYRDLSFTQIESLLMRSHPTSEDADIRESVTREYLTYVVDTLLSVVLRQGSSLMAKHIFVSGGVFSSSWIQNLFFDILSENAGYDGKKLHLVDAARHEKIPKEHLITSGLAVLGKELLHMKKDPIIRILRYTLYNYE